MYTITVFGQVVYSTIDNLTELFNIFFLLKSSEWKNSVQMRIS
jgi:hypothetical protein